MKKHKVILEVEVYVEDDESPEDSAEGVVDNIEDYIGLGSSGDPRVDGIRVISVDKEPLPPTEEELEEAREEAEAGARVDEFLAKAVPGTFVQLQQLSGIIRCGVLLEPQADIVSIRDRDGITRSWVRHEILHITEEELHCGHGHSHMNREGCAECALDVKIMIGGIHKRDVM